MRGSLSRNSARREKLLFTRGGLPAVAPRLTCDDLENQEGTMAALQYYRMIFELTDDAEHARICEALLKYCERDALAMVELWRALRAKGRP